MMKIGTLVRFAALVVLGVSLFGWAARLAAADPPGDSPANGLPISSTIAESCVSQTLAPGAQVWFKVPYHAGTDLEMFAKNAVGVNFDVYDPSQVANWPTLSPQPIGRLTPNKNEPEYTKSWQGHLAQGNVSDFYYVLITNTNTFEVTFSFCTKEKPLFTPPPAENACPPLFTNTHDELVTTITVAPVTSASDDITVITDLSIGPITTIGPDGCPYLAFPSSPER
jgi:hypothetical protein